MIIAAFDTLKCMHLLLTGSEQKRKACIQFTRMNLFHQVVLYPWKSHCHITGIFAGLLWGWGSHLVVQCNLFMISKVLLFVFVTQNKFPNFNADMHWFMYHLRSTYRRIVWTSPLIICYRWCQIDDVCLKRFWKHFIQISAQCYILQKILLLLIQNRIVGKTPLCKSLQGTSEIAVCL